MTTFAANLSTLYTDSPFLERFARARGSGFEHVEFQFPYEHDTDAIARALRENGLRAALFNLPAGDWKAGERGLAALPDRIEEFRRGVEQGIETARALGVPRLNCLVGARDPELAPGEQTRVMIENLRYAAQALAGHGIALLIEHLNPFDVPGFLLPTPSSAFLIQERVGSPNLFVQYDIYHAQRTEGELANTLQARLPRIGHIQLADNPGRHEPGSGEINFPFLLKYLDAIGYRGVVGLEYMPQAKTEDSFGWMGPSLTGDAS